ncbi:PREDICTED: UDP-glucuronosyltransferase 2B33-like [Priapulus caudatus]|uniref:UDP-glucuronosyltransferase 2B33-like n=1 Tax=Priapulus caudatus TaxID=37621 RepID=A0ABM1DW61_PRICU|nr:PREDICTED: UDP-glucuronosyltransferase 2B33-like [Priapulus caudatus]
MVFPAINYMLEYPRPMLPNVQLIGGLLAGPVRDLDWVEPYIAGAGERPVIFVSFGTLICIVDGVSTQGHPRTVAFVTHGGKNGLWEAIYHAVPMVAMPARC